MNDSHHAEGGFSLIEVLITIVIIVFALLGLAGLQARAMNAEAEAYARAQALLLAQDMADRIAANRSEAKLGAGGAYATADVFGTGHADADCTAIAPATPSDAAARDLCEWDLAIKGATETLGASTVTAVTGGRGCLAYTTSAGGDFAAYGILGQFVVTVAWEGREGFGTVPADVTCGSGVIIEARRRAVTLTVPLAGLDN